MSFESPVLLRGSDLACRRGGRRVFAGVSLHLGAGEALWLRGPNGCGKTSLLRLLAGLSRPSEGRVDAPAGPPAYLGHANALKDELSVAEALRFLCSLHGPRPDDRQLAAALDAIGLGRRLAFPDRKSTRLNSSHSQQSRMPSSA